MAQVILARMAAGQHEFNVLRLRVHVPPSLHFPLALISCSCSTRRAPRALHRSLLNRFSRRWSILRMRSIAGAPSGRGGK